MSEINKISEMNKMNKISKINSKISSLRLIFNVLKNKDFEFNIQLKSSIFIIFFDNDNSLSDID